MVKQLFLYIGSELEPLALGQFIFPQFGPLLPFFGLPKSVGLTKYELTKELIEHEPKL
jgi:hypothetical protein